MALSGIQQVSDAVIQQASSRMELISQVTQEVVQRNQQRIVEGIQNPPTGYTVIQQSLASGGGRVDFQV